MHIFCIVYIAYIVLYLVKIVIFFEIVKSNDVKLNTFNFHRFDLVFPQIHITWPQATIDGFSIHKVRHVNMKILHFSGWSGLKDDLDLPSESWCRLRRGLWWKQRDWTGHWKRFLSAV